MPGRWFCWNDKLYRYLQLLFFLYFFTATNWYIRSAHQVHTRCMLQVYWNKHTGELRCWVWYDMNSMLNPALPLPSPGHLVYECECKRMCNKREVTRKIQMSWVYFAPLGMIKWVCLSVHTHINPGGRSKWSAITRWQPTLCVVWCMIWRSCKCRTDCGHSWYPVSLLRPCR